jgi:SAM-dependent methyltransferase
MSQYYFKTLYFPGERTRSGKPSRVTISVPRADEEGAPRNTFYRRLQAMSGQAIRELLGNPVLEDFEDAAKSEGRSVSNAVLTRLMETEPLARVTQKPANGKSANGQLSLEFPDHEQLQTGERAFGVTFKESRRLPVHGWYPYVEGFSAGYVGDVIHRFGERPQSIYDPFGGAGTTQVAASHMGIPSFYCELNPFMTFVSEAKTASARWARLHFSEFESAANGFLKDVRSPNFQRRSKKISLSAYHAAFPERNFFDENDLRLLICARDLASLSVNDHFRNLLLLSCAANTVASSHMTRRADLRRRRPDEYKSRIVDVGSFVCTSVEQMLADIKVLPRELADVKMVGRDAKHLSNEYANSMSMAITSPPYLNGTNYFRNTKLELWLMGMIRSESDLQGFRTQAVCAGINDVTGPRGQPRAFAFVEDAATRLDAATKDRRIPTMVRHYFNDMALVMAETFKVLRPGGRFILDIGDSCFYGVHVPTDRLLAEVAQASGFILEAESMLARRYSRDRVQLRQVELVFRKPSKPASTKSHHSSPAVHSRIKSFQKALPYTKAPYTKRNWGHHFHSLCSYQGKLKPAIAHWLIREFVPAGAAVLDPLGGVGTIPFEAALAGHRVVSNDKSPLAATVARAKLRPPTLEGALVALRELEQDMATVSLNRDDFASADFGLNASVKDYFHSDTLVEVLKTRRVFLSRNDWDDARTFLWACILHILHGNRPYALSRRSHPITPFSPTGPTEYRSLIAKVRERLNRALGLDLPPEFQPGQGIQGDFRELTPDRVGQFDAIITSPPFMGMRFDRPNWLRLWFCGWQEATFHTESLSFLERQQVKGMACYEEFFATCYKLLKESGLLIIHIGSSDRDPMPEKLKQAAERTFRLVGTVVEDVQNVEKHGLKDKGRTTAHNFQFFQPR